MTIYYDWLQEMLDKRDSPDESGLGRAVASMALDRHGTDMARELLRLRDELTDLRDLMYTHAGYQRADGYGTAANWTSDHANRLARIIQGDTE